MHELEALKGARESIDRLEGQRKMVYGLYAAALIGRPQYLSSEDYHRVYKRLGLKVRVVSDGSLEVEGSVDANFLPTDIETASDVYWRMAEQAEERMFDEMTPNEKRRQAEFDYAVWAATSIRTETTTTRPSR